MPFSATWMDLEMIILSEVREQQKPYDVASMLNLNCGTDELICETETDSQTQRTNLGLPKGGDGIGSLGLADANYHKQDG